MGRKSKAFEDRKTAVGVSLTNATVRLLNSYCCRNSMTRSEVVELLLHHYLATVDGESELDTILDNEVYHYEGD